jgi:adenosine kinase
VIPIDDADIVDTNGAGDSFAGGFLAYFVKGAPLEKCIDAGSYAANANLKTRGCAVPPYPPAFA